MSSLIQIENDRFHDHCGVCGVFGHPEAAKLAYLGLYALQHRGQESAGIVSSDGRELHLEKSMGLVADIFRPEVLARLPGDAALGHTRYSTAGDTSLTNAQPSSSTATRESSLWGTTAICRARRNGAARSNIAARFSRRRATPK